MKKQQGSIVIKATHVTHYNPMGHETLKYILKLVLVMYFNVQKHVQVLEKEKLYIYIYIQKVRVCTRTHTGLWISLLRVIL